jgi:nuclear transport factor 2 (NTF2) superfamily protein
MGTPEAPRPPLPPFDETGALRKVRAAEDAWNRREPERVALAYSPDSRWRNRSDSCTANGRGSRTIAS